MVENPPVHRGLSLLGSDRQDVKRRVLARNTPASFLLLVQDATEERVTGCSGLSGLSGLFGSSGLCDEACRSSQQERLDRRDSQDQPASFYIEALTALVRV